MPKPTTATLLVLKTGLTTWDREGRIVGNTDLPLDEEEKASIDARLDALGSETGPKIILTAPDEASLEIAGRWGEAEGVKVRVVEALREMDLGLWEGALGEDLLARSPKLYKQWLSDPSSVQAPEGESFSEAERRVASGLMKAVDRLKSPSPIVGVVARKVAVGMVRRTIWEESKTDFWDLADAPWSRHELDEGGMDRLRRGAPALAAKGN